MLTGRRGTAAPQRSWRSAPALALPALPLPLAWGDEAKAERSSQKCRDWGAVGEAGWWVNSSLQEHCTKWSAWEQAVGPALPRENSRTVRKLLKPTSSRGQCCPGQRRNTPPPRRGACHRGQGRHSPGPCASPCLPSSPMTENAAEPGLKILLNLALQLLPHGAIVGP